VSRHVFKKAKASDPELELNLDEENSDWIRTLRRKRRDRAKEGPVKVRQGQGSGNEGT